MMYAKLNGYSVILERIRLILSPNTKINQFSQLKFILDSQKLGHDYQFKELKLYVLECAPRRLRCYYIRTTDLL